MKKRIVIISSIILAIVLLSVILILTLGDKGNNNTSSNIDTNSSEIISSTDESSSETDTSSDEVSSGTSSEEISSQTSTPSKTESTSTPTTSTNKTESKNETSSTPTTTPTTPTTYFEKHNLKLSPLTTNVCFNTDAGHKCGTHKKITMTKENLADKEIVYDDLVSEGKIDITKYNSLCFQSYDGWFDEDYSDCRMDANASTGGMAYVFDKYTGIILNTTFGWKEMQYNNKTYKAAHIADGGGGGWVVQTVYYPKDYDGLIFVKTCKEDKNNIMNDGKIHTIDEIIDFKNDKYYLFAAN